MNIPLIVLLVINYCYLNHFTYFYCSCTKNIMIHLGTSSRSFIEGSVRLTSTKDLQDIRVRQNIQGLDDFYSVVEFTKADMKTLVTPAISFRW